MSAIRAAACDPRHSRQACSSFPFRRAPLPANASARQFSSRGRNSQVMGAPMDSVAARISARSGARRGSRRRQRPCAWRITTELSPRQCNATKSGSRAASWSPRTLERYSASLLVPTPRCSDTAHITAPPSAAGARMNAPAPECPGLPRDAPSNSSMCEVAGTASRGIVHRPRALTPCRWGRPCGAAELTW